MGLILAGNGKVVFLRHHHWCAMFNFRRVCLNTYLVVQSSNHATFYLGGHSNSSATPLASGWVLDTDTSKWRELTAMIGKAIFWFKISPPEGNHLKVSQSLSFSTPALHSVSTERAMHIWWKILWYVYCVLLQNFYDFEIATIGHYYLWWFGLVLCKFNR